MGMLINEIVTNPYYDLVVAFSATAGIAFVVFLAGFLAGLEHLYKIDENQDNLNTYRIRAFWGATLLFATFVIWEVVRWILGLFA